MNFGVFSLSDSSVPDLNCAKNTKIAKAFKPPSPHPTQEG